MALRIGPISEVSFGNINGTDIIAVPRDQAVILMRKYILKYASLETNPFGLYTLASVGNNKNLTFASLTPPKHVFQPRLNGCSWNAKGKIGMNQTKVTLNEIEYDGEQCPDALWGAWEKLFGVGTDVINLRSGSGANALLDEFLELINVGLGNSFYELAEWGQHPIIEDAEANAWYPPDLEADEWDAYYGQQQAGVGRMTLVDSLKDDGLTHFNVDIESYLDADGNWTGDILDFFDSVIRARTTQFKVSENEFGSTIKGIIEVDEATFDEYGRQLLTMYTTIPDQYLLFLNGENGQQLRLNNALKYKGYAVIPNTAWTAFDEITGTINRRAMLSYPKVHGLMYDVDALNQYSGMGMLVQQLPDFRLKGRMDFWTTLKFGTSILDHKFVVNASKIYVPNE